MADPRIIGNFKSFADFQEAAQKNNLAEALTMAKLANVGSGGSVPAALQLANEYKARLASGDIEGANQILMFAKAADKGLVTDASGAFQAAPGYAPAIGGIEAAKAGMKQQAEKNVDVVMNPKIASGTAFATALGKDKGEKTGELKERIAGLPQLEDTVSQLSELGKKATYTTGGRAVDYVRTQAGLEPREQAVARAEYISLVDNQILPLLRQTFGAQFTQKEGESLKETLGDPDKSPKEKDAILRSFIDQKKATIDTMGRTLTQPQNLDDLLYNYQQQQKPVDPRRAAFEAKKSTNKNTRTTKSGITYTVE